ncbi:hypothetical protein V8E51_007405 [Hyaloscypha variabilis]
MAVQIQLDDPQRVYMNHETISGRIILNLTHSESVSAIVVKLEGESKSLIEREKGAFQQFNPSVVTADQRAGFQRSGTATENHKILYEVNQVFPIATGEKAADPVYTLRAGKHEYPFKFTISHDNECSHLPSQQKLPDHDPNTFWEASQLPFRHVKRVLPPTLASFGTEASIRYYIKVTVHRPSRLRENRRAERPFRFVPFDPPIVLGSSKEVYARRPYSFQGGPQGEVDARLPSPAILTWDKSIPLRILLRRSGENEEQVYLTFLQLRLFEFTEIRASDVTRVRTHIRPLLGLEVLTIPLWSPLEKETTLNSKLWDHLRFPHAAEPSFETCNLRRSYDLEVGLGLGYTGPPNARRGQTIFVPLRFQVEVFSGRDAASSSRAVQSDEPLPPTYDPSSRPENDAEDLLPGYEDATRSGDVVVESSGEAKGDLKGKISE